jgi:hypothetical protein
MVMKILLTVLINILYSPVTYCLWMGGLKYFNDENYPAAAFMFLVAFLGIILLNFILSLVFEGNKLYKGIQGE